MSFNRKDQGDVLELEFDIVLERTLDTKASICDPDIYVQKSEL